MKQIIYNIFTTFCLIAAPVSAENPFSEYSRIYIGINLAQSVNTTTNLEKKAGYKTTFPNFDFMLGIKITENYRLETSLGHRNFKYQNSAFYPDDDLPFTMRDNHKFSMHTLMLNHYYDFNTIENRFTPYVMAGAGISRAQAKTIYRDFITHTGTDHEETRIKATNSFAYQIGFGVDIKLTKNTSVDTSIRHVNYGKIKMSDDTLNTNAIKLKSNEVIVGLKYHF